ncbi:hypothetical protein CC78DRAFT_603240 [Lojkania enalia]|uniref:Osmotin, thaumatin-like protein n=1 Tax=Lojkania enalia TaxID=147567 RepID=A0A9P4K8K1_9PLEO|nr:hypothetical protein CC78DRAFT_603240 [Didymosphaeria enalia]
MGPSTTRASPLTLLATLLSLLTPTSAVNQVIIRNYCNTSLYFWTVYHDYAPPDWAHTSVPPRSAMTIPMLQHYQGAIALKIRDIPHYAVAPAGILQLEYNLAGRQVWYDLSIIDCDVNAGPTSPLYCPFVHGGVMLRTSDRTGRCPTAHCEGPVCSGAYLRPGGWLGEPTFVCPAGNDLLLEVCTGREVNRTGWVRDGARVYPRLQCREEGKGNIEGEDVQSENGEVRDKKKLVHLKYPGRTSEEQRQETAPEKAQVLEEKREEERYTLEQCFGGSNADCMVITPVKGPKLLRGDGVVYLPVEWPKD